MSGMETWQLISVERERVADFLHGLAEQDWKQPSLCPGWTVRDVVAHIVSTAEMTPGKFVAGLAGNGFRFHRMSAANIAKLHGEPPERLVSRLRASMSSRNHPPGPVAAMLMEIVVHGEDMAYPLGKPIDHSPEALIGAADFAKNSQPLVGCKKRVAGLRLRATDAEWSTGEGPEVSGPLPVLLLAMAGRRQALDDLTGEAVASLRARP